MARGAICSVKRSNPRADIKLHDMTMPSRGLNRFFNNGALIFPVGDAMLSPSGNRSDQEDQPAKIWLPRFRRGLLSVSLAHV